MPDFRANKIGFLMGALRDYGEIVRFRFGPKTIHLIQHPDHVKAILGPRHLDFIKASRGFNKLRMLLGNGLVTSIGEFWQRQRRIAQPSFHYRRISAFVDVFTGAAEETLAGWEPYASSGEPLDIYPEMSRLTLLAVVRSLLGSDLPAGGFDTVNDGLETALEHMNHNIYRLFDVPSFVPTRRNRRFQEAVRAMDDLVYGLIEERRREQDIERNDLLAMLMEARDEETGEGMEDLHLRDEVMTTMLAGHETTALGLTWAFYLLSTHPDVRRRLQDEIDSVLGDRPPRLEDVRELRYTTQVIHETLRLYPPLWAFSRLALKDFELGGFHIPANSTIFISPYVTHRQPDYWENPEGFDPERFADESWKRSKYAFLPFGGGPRNCIGGNFAILEMQMVLPMIVQRYRLDLQPGYQAELRPLLTLRPRGEVPMILQARGSVDQRQGGGELEGVAESRG